jgi:hypothetical protein
MINEQIKNSGNSTKIMLQQLKIIGEVSSKFGEASLWLRELPQSLRKFPHT